MILDLLKANREKLVILVPNAFFMLILSFIIFFGALLGMGWMVIRVFPELSRLTVVQHKHLVFLGIEDVHILKYKFHSDVFKKNFLLFFEKLLRRCRSWILKLDNFLSFAIERVQQKIQALDVPADLSVTQESYLSKIKNLSLLSKKQKQNDTI